MSNFGTGAAFFGYDWQDAVLRRRNQNQFLLRVQPRLYGRVWLVDKLPMAITRRDIPVF